MYVLLIPTYVCTYAIIWYQSISSYFLVTIIHITHISFVHVYYAYILCIQYSHMHVLTLVSFIVHIIHHPIRKNNHKIHNSMQMTALCKSSVFESFLKTYCYNYVGDVQSQSFCR